MMLEIKDLVAVAAVLLHKMVILLIQLLDLQAEVVEHNLLVELEDRVHHLVPIQVVTDLLSKVVLAEPVVEADRAVVAVDQDITEAAVVPDKHQLIPAVAAVVVDQGIYTHPLFLTEPPQRHLVELV
jgi:hypothetical protein